jgi:hypothetical protein
MSYLKYKSMPLVLQKGLESSLSIDIFTYMYIVAIKVDAFFYLRIFRFTTVCQDRGICEKRKELGVENGTYLIRSNY